VGPALDEDKECPSGQPKRLTDSNTTLIYRGARGSLELTSPEVEHVDLTPPDLAQFELTPGQLGVAEWPGLFQLTGALSDPACALLAATDDRGLAALMTWKEEELSDAFAFDRSPHLYDPQLRDLATRWTRRDLTRVHSREIVRHHAGCSLPMKGYPHLATTHLFCHP
jgi:hypothetical protein